VARANLRYINVLNSNNNNNNVERHAKARSLHGLCTKIIIIIIILFAQYYNSMHICIEAILEEQDSKVRQEQ